MTSLPQPSFPPVMPSSFAPASILVPPVFAQATGALPPVPYAVPSTVSRPVVLPSAPPIADMFNRNVASAAPPAGNAILNNAAKPSLPTIDTALSDSWLEKEKPQSNGNAAPQEEDPFKTKFRLVGYINEACEALKTPIEAFFGLFGADKKVLGSKLVNPWSYNVVYAYSALDGLYMGKKEYEQNKELKQNHRVFNAASKGLDTLAFQYMASVEIPAFIVSSARLGMETGLGLATEHSAQLNPVQKLLNLTVGKPTQWLAHHSGELLNKVPLVRNNNLVKQSLPVVAALALIPLCIKPVDAFSQKLLDLTFRPASKWLEERLFGQSRLKYEGKE
jgi:hypothetical protein